MIGGGGNEWCSRPLALSFGAELWCRLNGFQMVQILTAVFNTLTSFLFRKLPMGKWADDSEP